MTENEQVIRQMTIDYYITLFTAETVVYYNIDMFLTGLTSIDETERRHLEKLITFDDMSTALSLMKNGKSSGLDGIPFEWCKKFWNIIGHDLHDVFLYSIKTDKLPTSCRQGVITLLLKNGDNGLLKTGGL